MSGLPRLRPRLEDLLPVEQRLLPVLRHFLCSLQGDAPRAWQLAYGTAAEVWGEARGLAIAHRAQAFLSALLNSRPVPLRHADPLCPEARLQLTEDEHALLALLMHMRADETAPARNWLANLTGGRVEAAVVHTALDLCVVLDGRAPAKPKDQPRARLQVVG